MAAENGRIVVGNQLLHREDYRGVLEELAQFDPAQREAIERYLIMQRAAAEASQHRAQRGTADAEVDLGSFIQAGYDIAAVRNAIAARPWEHPVDEATALQRTVHSIIGDRNQHYKDLELRLYKMHDALKGVAVDIRDSDFATYEGVNVKTMNANVDGRDVFVRFDLQKGTSSDTCMGFRLPGRRIYDNRGHVLSNYTVTIARPFLFNGRISINQQHSEFDESLSEFYDREWGTTSASQEMTPGRILLAALGEVPAFVQKTLEKDGKYFAGAVKGK